MAASKAFTKARAVAITNRHVPAYPAPSAPSALTVAPITKGQVKALSPVAPLPTIKEA